MPFALKLRELLSFRETLLPGEFAKGDTLESVLDAYLRDIEMSGDADMRTSILLLDGTTLHHGAAPRIPRAYLDAVNGSQIGPTAGSCGTAAFLGHPIYVSDIANDPLWENYRDLALPHGLRACWSTPIRNDQGRLLGTFAIYNVRPREVVKEEIEAISMITVHVARAIMWYRGSDFEADAEGGHEEGGAPQRARPHLRLISDSDG
jgi:GAF domain-containing protein